MHNSGLLQKNLPPRGTAEDMKKAKPNDKAVMKAYGYAPGTTEPEIVADLMNRYLELTANE